MPTQFHDSSVQGVALHSVIPCEELTTARPSSNLIRENGDPIVYDLIGIRWSNLADCFQLARRYTRIHFVARVVHFELLGNLQNFVRERAMSKSRRARVYGRRCRLRECAAAPRRLPLSPPGRNRFQFPSPLGFGGRDYFTEPRVGIRVGGVSVVSRAGERSGDYRVSRRR